ncbi:transglutaminase family protein [Leifsonia sp. Leaf264]|uniref:transglutaminase family protein n=1 Tax=Leifsonia sp. Leaf264 TaxID=1736314 RepID=UPI0006FDF471|nr:DUF3488 and transglutaminase-like domain-containing protein [Leifsonia sp. Leaf264]KQP01322.1 hypothetical protein ASF30_01470 [Leifsonia sp. Leaf264]
MSRSETLPRFAERGRNYWPLTGCLVVLLLVASMALGPVLRGSGWWWVMAAVSVITLVSAAAFRQLGWGRSIVPLASGGVLILTLTLFFGEGSGLLWLVPTPGTIDQWGALTEAGMLSIQQQAVPAVVYPGVMFLLTVGAGLLAIALDVVAITLRLPAVAGALVLIPVSVPALITKSGTDVAALVLTACAYLLLLRVDVRIRRRSEAATRDRGRAAPRSTGPERRGPGPIWGSLGVGAIAIVSALVLSAATPALSDSSVISNKQTGVLFGSGVSPLIDLGQDLRRPEASLAMHYGTTADDQPYFKLLTLDSFSDDLEWVAGRGATDLTNTVDDFGPPEGLTDAVKRDDIRTIVQIDTVVSSWLPVPYPATSIEGLDGDWQWDDGALTVSSEKSTTRGQDYKVDGLELKPTAEQLRASGTDYPTAVQQYLELPENAPGIIGELAAEETANVQNPYDAAVALQRYFRSSAFAYSTEAPVDEGYDGGSLDVIAKFLDVKKGYCIHFASAMAIMARTLGIPSRIALGYLPGESSRDTMEGLPRWNVTTHDLHTWPELYFPGVGWVPFEPTTGRGSIPDYARGVGQSSAAPVAPSTNDQANRDQALQGRNENMAGAATAAQASLVWVQITAVVLAALLVLLLPFLIRTAGRLQRRRRVASGRASPSLLWRELVDTSVDLGLGVPDTETARHLASRLSASGGLTEAASASLGRLRDAVEHERYARLEAQNRHRAQALVDDLDAVLAALRSGVDLRSRVRAALLPRSLRPEAFGPGRGRRAAAA